MFQKLIHPVPGRFKTPMPSGQLLLWFLRVCFGAIIIGLSMAAFNSVLEAYRNIAQAYAVFSASSASACSSSSRDLWIANKQITTISALYFGLLLGLLLGNILSTALEPFVFDLAGTRPRTPADIHMLRRGLHSAHHRRLLLHLHFHPAADQGRIPLHHPLRGILQADQGRPAAGSRHQCNYRRPNCRYL